MAKKTKKEPVDTNEQSEAVAPPTGGLQIELNADKVMAFGGERIIIKVRLLKDGVVISSDEDYVVL